VTTPHDESARRAELSFTVTAADTAQELGSGDLQVLATPRLLAWCEAATCAAAADVVGVGRTTVGTRVQLEHRAASAVGSRVQVVAEVLHVDGRLLRFSVAASASDGRLLATGEITRVAVDPERFLGRLPSE
jgi:predicted thioesterase